MTTGGTPRERLGTCLRLLRSHASEDSVALAGGGAIEFHLAERGLPRRRAFPTDVDIVAPDAEAISPSATSDFLVSHFHRPHRGYPKFMLQLVHPATRLRVDVFPGASDSIRRAKSYDAWGVAIRVLDLDTILDHKLAVLERATERQPVDDKHYRDAVMLGRLLGREVDVVPANVLCAVEYSTDPRTECSRCRCSLDERWPLAPKREILDVLGYV